MTFVQLILALLKLARVLLDIGQQNKWMQAGADAEVAKASAALLAQTEFAKHVREKVASLDERAVDGLLRDLEPKP